MANGKENGGPIANPNKEFDSLVNGDITTPGYIRLPVCTEPAARLAWSNADKTSSVRGLSYFPCNPANGRDYCGDSTFVDQGSDGSPLISDCEQIIKDIESTDSSWNTFIEMQRDIRHSGTCHFGVTGKGRKGNSNFDVGGQDVIDIIRDAIRKFGRPDGRVGAKGIMQCNGNIKKQKVEWGLY